jgi:hypothetical protein
MRSMVEGHPPRLLTKKAFRCTCPSTSLRLVPLPRWGRNDY